MISTLILAAMMATNVVDRFSHTKENDFFLINTDILNIPPRYLCKASGEILLRYDARVEVISTNCVLHSEFKPIVTQSNGVYVIRFQQPKIFGSEKNMLIHTNQITGNEIKEVAPVTPRGVWKIYENEIKPEFNRKE